jgi:hypothetical protein
MRWGVLLGAFLVACHDPVGSIPSSAAHGSDAGDGKPALSGPWIIDAGSPEPRSQCPNGPVPWETEEATRDARATATSLGFDESSGLSIETIAKLTYLSRSLRPDSRFSDLACALLAPSADSLGFGARRFNAPFTVLDGPGQGALRYCSVAVAGYEEHVASIRARCTPVAKGEALLRLYERLFPRWAPSADQGIAFAFDDALVLREMNDVRAKALGALVAVVPPAPLRASYETLLEPSESLMFGHACGFGGTRPPGRREMDTLVTAGRFDLIRNVLRGPTPEGRAFAAEALRNAHRVTADDRATFAAIRRSGGSVAFCEGCTVHGPEPEATFSLFQDPP